MKLISHKFLQSINEEYNRDRILNSLFKDEEAIALVIEKKKLSFEKACDWVATICFENLKEAPEANEAEKVIMQRVAKELIDEWRKTNDDTAKIALGKHDFPTSGESVLYNQEMEERK